jgi:hypothetical protein
VSDEDLEREALRVYRRYQREFVERLSICPFATRAREEGHVRERVLTSGEPDLAETLAVIAELSADADVHIGLLIYPRASIGRVEFERFVARARAEDAQRWPGGRIPMASAAFHPEADPDLVTPARLVPFLRRTPDPTIQLVRHSVLDRVRRNTDHGTGFVDPAMLDPRALAAAAPPAPALHERVAAGNVETIQKMGVEEAERILRDIFRDRSEAYARLLGA